MSKVAHFKQLRMVTVAVAGTLLLSGVASAQPAVSEADEAIRKSLPSLIENGFRVRVSTRRDSQDVLNLVRPVLKDLKQSVVTVFAQGKPTTLGTIVSQYGHVITKASELGSLDENAKLRVRLADRRLLDAEVISVRRPDDLALLKFETTNAVPVRLENIDPAVGTFVISAGVDGEVIGLGVVGNEPRNIAERGKLGILFEPVGVGVRVTTILPGSAASTVGIRRGDVLISVNGKEIKDPLTLKSEIELMFPGEKAKLKVARGEENFEADVEVRDESVLHESESDARVHGARSGRLAGFDKVLQHDTVLEPEQCGGPIVDLSGHVVGINIARAGRVTSFALTTKTLLPIIQSMVSTKTP